MLAHGATSGSVELSDWKPEVERSLLANEGCAVCGQPFSGLGGDGIDGLVECQIDNRFSY
jgi:hypothetical protein